MIPAVTIAAVAGLVLGFVSGLLAANLKLWCDRCGVTKECPSHGQAAEPAPARPSNPSAMQKPAES